jgi:hypothetical protein
VRSDGGYFLFDVMGDTHDFGALGRVAKSLQCGRMSVLGAKVSHQWPGYIDEPGEAREVEQKISPIRPHSFALYDSLMNIYPTGDAQMIVSARRG